MIWENLTVDEFNDSLKETKGVVLVPIGCLEKHGNHMPLGTDILIARTMSIKASEKEPAMVFPYIPFGIVGEVKHKKGTISLTSNLIYHMLEELCDELARNGYHKIIILNGHGGSINFANYFAQSRLEKYHPYIVYVYRAHTRTRQQQQEFLNKYGPLNGSGHADLIETSEIMYLNPDTIHLDRIVPEETKPLLRNEFLGEKGIFTAINWYGNYPYHIAGDPTGSTKEKGEFVNNLHVQNFAEAIKTIKEDDVSLKLQEEFYKKANQPEI